MFVFTTAIQAVRILSIWASCKAVGIDLGPRIYYVMGPLFFLVLLVPFTLNGFAVREAFFVSFLGSVGVDADAAFAAGFLFFLVTVALALPGRRDPALGGRPRRRAAARSSMADGVARRCVVVTLQRAALDRAVPRRASRGVADGRRRQRLDATTRVDVVRERFPEVRVVEQANRGLAAGWNRGHRGGRAEPLRPDPQRRRVARRRTRSTRLVAVGRRAPARRGRRAAAAQPGRDAAALGARLPDALAARDRVLLPPQARAALARAERVLRRGLRPRRASARWSA